MDWEYLIPFLFAHYKYQDFKQRNAALKSVKYAFFERRFSHILKRYQPPNIGAGVNKGPIWVCWLQGEEQMPCTIKRCYERLKTMAPAGREVILLEWRNLDNYVKLPDYIIEKVKRGTINYTHFSDILRFSLLAEHGGLWVDSSLYVNSPIPESVFEQDYFSIYTDFDFNYVGVNRCLWKCFLLGARSHSTWFSCARDIIYEYWKSLNLLIDYLVVDYILLLIYDSNHEVKKAVDSAVEFAPHVLHFEKIANEPCVEETYRKMCGECRWFKLSYKLPFKEYTDDGALTYFGRLMSDPNSD